MKHKKKIVKLGRMTSHRKAMLNNMASSVVSYRKIHTTVQKAKAVTPLVHKLITWGKNGSLSSRRLAFRVLKDRSMVKKLFVEVAPLMNDYKGGYTRIIRTGVRHGDGASMAILELVGQSAIAEDKGKAVSKKDKKKASKKESKKEK